MIDDFDSVFSDVSQFKDLLIIDPAEDDENIIKLKSSVSRERQRIKAEKEKKLNFPILSLAQEIKLIKKELIKEEVKNVLAEKPTNLSGRPQSSLLPERPKQARPETAASDKPKRTNFFEDECVSKPVTPESKRRQKSRDERKPQELNIVQRLQTIEKEIRPKSRQKLQEGSPERQQENKNEISEDPKVDFSKDSSEVCKDSSLDDSGSRPASRSRSSRESSRPASNESRRSTNFHLETITEKKEQNVDLSNSSKDSIRSSRHSSKQRSGRNTPLLEINESNPQINQIKSRASSKSRSSSQETTYKSIDHFLETISKEYSRSSDRSSGSSKSSREKSNRNREQLRTIKELPSLTKSKFLDDASDKVIFGPNEDMCSIPKEKIVGRSSRSRERRIITTSDNEYETKSQKRSQKVIDELTKLQNYIKEFRRKSSDPIIQKTQPQVSTKVRAKSEEPTVPKSLLGDGKKYTKHQCSAGTSPDSSPYSRVASPRPQTPYSDDRSPQYSASPKSEGRSPKCSAGSRRSGDRSSSSNRSTERGISCTWKHESPQREHKSPERPQKSSESTEKYNKTSEEDKEGTWNDFSPETANISPEKGRRSTRQERSPERRPKSAERDNISPKIDLKNTWKDVSQKRNYGSPEREEIRTWKDERVEKGLISPKRGQGSLEREGRSSERGRRSSERGRSTERENKAPGREEGQTRKDISPKRSNKSSEREIGTSWKDRSSERRQRSTERELGSSDRRRSSERESKASEREEGHFWKDVSSKRSNRSSEQEIGAFWRHKCAQERQKSSENEREATWKHFSPEQSKRSPERESRSTWKNDSQKRSDRGQKSSEMRNKNPGKEKENAWMDDSPERGNWNTWKDDSPERGHIRQNRGQRRSKREDRSSERTDKSPEIEKGSKLMNDNRGMCDGNIWKDGSPEREYRSSERLPRSPERVSRSIWKSGRSRSRDPHDSEEIRQIKERSPEIEGRSTKSSKIENGSPKIEDGSPKSREGSPVAQLPKNKVRQIISSSKLPKNKNRISKLPKVKYVRSISPSENGKNIIKIPKELFDVLQKPKDKLKPKEYERSLENIMKHLESCRKDEEGLNIAESKADLVETMNRIKSKEEDLENLIQTMVSPLKPAFEVKQEKNRINPQIYQKIRKSLSEMLHESNKNSVEIPPVSILQIKEKDYLKDRISDMENLRGRLLAQLIDRRSSTENSSTELRRMYKKFINLQRENKVLEKRIVFLMQQNFERIDDLKDNLRYLTKQESDIVYTYREVKSRIPDLEKIQFENNKIINKLQEIPLKVNSLTVQDLHKKLAPLSDKKLILEKDLLKINRESVELTDRLQHKRRMLSLEKAETETGVKKLEATVRFLTDLKKDLNIKFEETKRRIRKNSVAELQEIKHLEATVRDLKNDLEKTAEERKELLKMNEGLKDKIAKKTWEINSKEICHKYNL